MFQIAKVVVLGVALFGAHASGSAAHQGSHPTSQHHQGSHAHAPIGVTGDHLLSNGEWMLSYRRMDMTMAGNRDGTRSMDLEEILRSGSGRYSVAPVRMQMAMHMVGLMYAPSKRATFMMMVPWVKNRMDLVTHMGETFTTGSSDLGDLKISVLLPLNEYTVTNVGFTFPSGGLNHRDVTPMGRTVLPYAMQTGSGSYALSGAVTHKRRSGQRSWGGQASAIVRTNDNRENYRLGNQLQATAWIAREFGDIASLSIRGIYRAWGAIDGEDPRYTLALANNLMPTVDPRLRSGRSLGIAVGGSFRWTKGHRIAVEFTRSVWQDLEGPQLETDRVLQVGGQLVFPN